MPAAAVKQNPQALSGFIGRKESVGVSPHLSLNLQGLTLKLRKRWARLRALGADGTDGVGVKSVDIVGNTKSEGIQLGRP